MLFFIIFNCHEAIIRFINFEIDDAFIFLFNSETLCYDTIYKLHAIVKINILDLWKIIVNLISVISTKTKITGSITQFQQDTRIGNEKELYNYLTGN